jgi:hypothetical protein
MKELQDNGKESYIPKFRDVPVRKVYLKKSGKVVLFAPHSSEYNAVFTLNKKLSKKLKEEGIATDEEIIGNTRERILINANALSDRLVSKYYNDNIETLFKLEDALVRLYRLAGILLLNQRATVLEVHALGKDYKEDDEFWMADYFYRLRDARVLVLRDLYKEYSEPIKNGMELLEDESLMTKVKNVVRRALGETDLNHTPQEIAGCFMGIDMEIDPIRYPKMLEVLSENLDRVAMIEIPADSDFLTRITEVERFEEVVNRITKVRPLTEFEERYGLKMSLTPRIPDADIEAIVKLLVPEGK